jgi:hypothetical protein
VSQLEPADGSKEGPHATVRFAQIAHDRCLVEAILDQFPPGTPSHDDHARVQLLVVLVPVCVCVCVLTTTSTGEYDLAVHEFGDLSDAERTVGHVLGRHADDSTIKPAGEIGRVQVGQDGVRAVCERDAVTGGAVRCDVC